MVSGLSEFCTDMSSDVWPSHNSQRALDESLINIYSISPFSMTATLRTPYLHYDHSIALASTIPSFIQGPRRVEATGR